MKTNSAYIKISDDVDDDNFSPSDEQLMLDNFPEEEYSTPYTCYEDPIDVDMDTYTGSIFDDR